MVVVVVAVGVGWRWGRRHRQRKWLPARLALCCLPTVPDTRGIHMDEVHQLDPFMQQQFGSHRLLDRLLNGYNIWVQPLVHHIRKK